jgi:alkylhydroperoxidase family enzyme
MRQSWPERLVTGLLETMCRAMWGFTPKMVRHIVRRLGPVGAPVWFAANMPRYLWTMQVLGPLRTHLAAVAISLHNSCTYCAYGHAYALELIYLRDHGRLFPVDAHTLAGWRGLPPRELGSRLHRALQEAGLHVEALWVDRTLALATGATRPVDRDEARLAHMVRMIGRINRIAVEAGVVEPDEAQNPVNKDSALKARHAQLRTAAS